MLPAYAGVLPPSTRRHHEHSGAPRIRGGDPENSPDFATMGEVFPAYSGLTPFRHTSAGDRCRVPRIRGGDPMSPRPPTSSGECSLHMRG